MAAKDRQDSPGLCRVPAARQGPGQLVAHGTERLFGLASSRMGSAGLGPFSRRAAEEGPLRVSPMTPFPDSGAGGGGTGLLLDGNCSHPSGPLERLWVAVGDREVEALGWGMPRRGLSDGDYWWGIVPIEPVAEPRDEWVPLRARLASGHEAVSRLGTIGLLPTLSMAAAEESAEASQSACDAVGGAEGPVVAIAMATFEPPIELFQRQIDSIRQQTHRNWICVISDAAASPGRVGEMREVLADDPRFVLSLAPERLGFYHNFERALSMVPRRADPVALCDQDDRWHPDK